MLLATLWNTGARINEALALTRSDFSLTPPYPFVQLATLKQRTEKATRTAGRARPVACLIVSFRFPMRTMSASWR
jgi:integrase